MQSEVNAEWVFVQYERLRPVLPEAAFPANTARIESFAEISGRFDVFLFDAFGVLNIGDTPAPGAVQAIADLQRRGRQVIVLTNGASLPPGLAVRKFQQLGFDFSTRQLVSSRDALACELAGRHKQRWGVMAPESARGEELPLNSIQPLRNRADFDIVDGFVLLSAAGWTEAQQDMLVQSLLSNPRPVLVGNPDIAAPRETGFSLQAGWYACDIINRTGIRPLFFGKPFASVFDLALSRLPPGVPKDRILMVGDTLHTDILGGAAAGIKTLLLTDCGIFAGRDVHPFIAQSGIVPDWICNGF
ncbi:MAG TPA: HAD-IIA family hydrolase [Devosia sp.]|nr:HAD-IIA family hydrolase [Devosia sp.]